ncbi:transcriptional regulator NanR [Martelella mediterranea]|uniref:transcriptional regulator NanR n=1 Tax=Martelella mediterranea TaxID=293089 RepID=UPI001E488EB6|nr:transcriptional regulator NanR [Martelella mediterranea]MCD1634804.1 transcriptional regulator NanR [Martelella mediterranea]
MILPYTEYTSRRNHALSQSGIICRTSAKMAKSLHWTGVCELKKEIIRKKKLSDEVRERLLAEIEEGHLPPGAPLPSERELMEALGVGRPAIREAMQSLQNLGLIQVRHGERPRVAEPQLDLLAEQLALTMHHVLTYDSNVLAQLKEARLLMEAQLARIAAEKATGTDVADLKAIVAQQAELTEETPRFMEMDGNFHGRLAEISGNLLMASVVRAIFAWLERFHPAAVRTTGLEKVTLEEHRAIIAAIEAGDGQAADQAMRHHLSRANTLYRPFDDPA